MFRHTIEAGEQIATFVGAHIGTNREIRAYRSAGGYITLEVINKNNNKPADRISLSPGQFAELVGAAPVTAPRPKPDGGTRGRG